MQPKMDNWDCNRKKTYQYNTADMSFFMLPSLIESLKGLFMNELKDSRKSSITPKHNLVFKRIFGEKGNEGILKDFLESI